MEWTEGSLVIVFFFYCCFFFLVHSVEDMQEERSVDTIGDLSDISSDDDLSGDFSDEDSKSASYEIKSDDDNYASLAITRVVDESTMDSQKD